MSTAPRRAPHGHPPADDHAVSLQPLSIAVAISNPMAVPNVHHLLGVRRAYTSPARVERCLSLLSGGSGEEGGDDVGGVAVKRHSRPVVAHGGARIRVAGGLLHVAEGDAGVEGGGDEGVAQGVGADRFGDPGPAGDAAHHPPGGVTVETAPVATEEDRAFAAIPDSQVHGPGRAGSDGNGNDLAALADHGQGAIAAFEAESSDVGAQRL